MIFGLFGDKTERESKQLNRDAPTIIAEAEKGYAPARLRAMAETITKYIDRAYTRYGTEPIDLKRAHYDFRSIHKETRRKNDQVGLSAMTLVIIYIRAEIAGPMADPARAAIKAFTTTWLQVGGAQDGASNGGA